MILDFTFVRRDKKCRFKSCKKHLKMNKCGVDGSFYLKKIIFLLGLETILFFGLAMLVDCFTIISVTNIIFYNHRMEINLKLV